MFNKKGVSAIIATVLLILITIATVTIVWSVVVPMVQDNLGQAESFTDCIYAAEQFQILENENACYSLTGSTVTLNIPTKLGGKDFNFYGLAFSSTFESKVLGYDSSIYTEEVNGKIIDPLKLPSIGGQKIINIDHILKDHGPTIGFANSVVGDSLDVSLTVLTMRNDKESSCGDTTKTITLSACPLA